MVPTEQVLSNPTEMQTGNERGLSSKSSRDLRWSSGFGKLPIVVGQLQIQYHCAVYKMCELLQMGHKSSELIASVPN